MQFFQEFRKFIDRGSVIDMAVGIILGASFTKIVDVLVNHILMPPIGFVINGVDFSQFQITLKQGGEGQPPITIDYGLLINALINFIIVAISIFVLIKIINRIYMKGSIFNKQTCPECKMEIPIDAKRCGHCTSEFKKPFG